MDWFDWLVVITVAVWIGFVIREEWLD